MFRIILAVIFLALVASLRAQTAGPLPVSTVCYVQNAEAVTRLEENPRVTRRMVDALVMAVTGEKEVGAAWRTLVTPKDRVGIKVSAAGGRYFSSHLGVVEAIVAGLEQAGVPASQIIVWDRDAERLAQARFVSRRGGYTVRGIGRANQYDRDAQVVAPVLGRLIWGDLLFDEKQRRNSLLKVPEADMLSSTSHVAGVLSREITKVINVI
ncbi:MAG: hypothetical protein V4710_07535 [Verrucomicrobiota bacterium]